MEDLEVFSAYGKTTEPEVEAEIVDPVDAIDSQDVVTQSSALVNFNVTQVFVGKRNEDTSVLLEQADQFKQISAKGIQGLADFLASDLIGAVNQAAAQNRHGVAGAQAYAATEAIKNLQNGGGV